FHSPSSPTRRSPIKFCFTPCFLIDSASCLNSGVVTSSIWRILSCIIKNSVGKITVLPTLLRSFCNLSSDSDWRGGLTSRELSLASAANLFKSTVFFGLFISQLPKVINYLARESARAIRFVSDKDEL